MRQNRLDSRSTARMLAEQDHRAVVSHLASKVSPIATAKYQKRDGVTYVWDTFDKVWRRF